MLNGFIAAPQFSTQGRELSKAASSHIDIDTHNFIQPID